MMLVLEIAVGVTLGETIFAVASYSFLKLLRRRAERSLELDLSQLRAEFENGLRRSDPEPEPERDKLAYVGATAE
jgi:hypothetical protein